MSGLDKPSYSRSVTKIQLWALNSLLVAMTFWLTADGIVTAGCTSFSFTRLGQPFLAHNFDFPQEFERGLIFVNFPGVEKHSWRSNFLNGWHPDSETEGETWIAKYGSVTFNLVGLGMVQCGMNENGLSVSTMELAETEPSDAEDTPNIEAVTWIQFLLDTCSNVDEVVRSSQRFDVDGFCHFLFADANGDTAIVEWVKGEPVIVRGKSLNGCVLTNSTNKISSEIHQQSIRKLGKRLSVPDDWKRIQLEPDDLSRSLERFCIVRSILDEQQNEKENAIDFAFSTLRSARQEHPEEPGRGTQWSVVFDISEKKLYFHTRANPQQRHIDMASIDFSKRQAPQMYYVQSPDVGSLNALFFEYDHEISVRHTAEVTRAYCKFKQISPPENLQLWAERSISHLESR